MRLKLFIFNSIKELIYKIPVLRDLYFVFKPYAFNIFKFLGLRRYLHKNLMPRIHPTKSLIIKFKKIYERKYFDENVNIAIEFLEKKILSAWKGHRYFALWLVKELKPTTIVDLGVDKGYSSFIFAAQKIGKVYGIDWFMGMSLHKKVKKKERADYVSCMRYKRKIQRKFGIQNVTIIKGKFSEVAKKWKIPIDILHIDGTHIYEDVKEDYQIWSKFLNTNSVVLFHDTIKFEGVKQFFNELELPKYNFTHSHGLGVASKNKDLILMIKKIYDISP
ncbi:MAG: class I SAM-dependent methyltransferase [Candidatus Thorarchaeota archaeon]